MTLAATTVSIVLTFGTTAIIDRSKEKADKKEMVMMIMYDMRESIKEFERVQKDLVDFYEIQVDVVAHPELFDASFIDLLSKVPVARYSSTTENIFRSNIETIHTLGSVLFVETVTSFYDERKGFESSIVKDVQDRSDKILSSYGNLRDFNSPNIIFIGETYLRAMKRDFEHCKMLMKVTDEKLDVYSLQQQKLLEATEKRSVEDMKEYYNEQEDRSLRLQRARQEGNLQND